MTDDMIRVCRIPPEATTVADARQRGLRAPRGTGHHRNGCGLPMVKHPTLRGKSDSGTTDGGPIPAHVESSIAPSRIR